MTMRHKTAMQLAQSYSLSALREIADHATRSADIISRTHDGSKLDAISAACDDRADDFRQLAGYLQRIIRLAE